MMVIDVGQTRNAETAAIVSLVPSLQQIAQEAGGGQAPRLSRSISSRSDRTSLSSAASRSACGSATCGSSACAGADARAAAGGAGEGSEALPAAIGPPNR